MDERVRLTPGKNPFFQHGQAAYFLAREGSRIVGRVAASTDQNHDSIHGERQAAFGFFEADTADAAAALLERAAAWGKEQGAEVLRGPLSFTTNDECGLLIEGFEHRPAIMMPHNPPEYAAWIEAAGLVKAMDLYTFRARIPNESPPVFRRIASAARRTPGLVTRPVAMKRFDEELTRVKSVYNEAWEKNWGFVPMTDGEIDHMAKQLRPAIVPELVRFVEVDGMPIGFGLIIPDINIALRHLGGRLFPFGIVRLLLTLPRIREGRLMALGVRSNWRRKGVAPLLVDELILALRAKNYGSVEIGWTLETNDDVNSLITGVGGVRTGTYRIYERRLG
jgi:GNAT superfamily N-acetyltransferase